MGFLLGFFLGLVIGLMLYFDNRIGFKAESRRYWAMDQQGKKQLAYRALYDTNLCAELAGRLDIQADDGEAADAVRCAIEDCWKKADQAV